MRIYDNRKSDVEYEVPTRIKIKEWFLSKKKS